MAIQQFKIKFTIEKEFLINAQDVCEAEAEARRLLKENTNLGNFNILKTDTLNVTEYNDMMKNVRKDVIDYMDENSVDIAESHIEAWEDFYMKKSKSQIEYVLNVSYDLESESISVEEDMKRKLKDEDFKLNEDEIKYVQDRFIKSVLEFF